jgi:hypothetical protein
MLGSEVSVCLADVLPLAGLRVGDLDVGCEVLVAPVGRDFSPAVQNRVSVISPINIVFYVYFPGNFRIISVAQHLSCANLAHTR